MTLNNSINLGYATVTMREDGIVNTNILLETSATLEQAKELLIAYIQVTNGVNTPHPFTVTTISIMDDEVMEFIKTTANNHGVADAFVIHSLAQKILANTFLRFQTPTIPTKFFSSEEKAVEWLKEYL